MPPAPTTAKEQRPSSEHTPNLIGRIRRKAKRDRPAGLNVFICRRRAGDAIKKATVEDNAQRRSVGRRRHRKNNIAAVLSAD